MKLYGEDYNDLRCYIYRLLCPMDTKKKLLISSSTEFFYPVKRIYGIETLDIEHITQSFCNFKTFRYNSVYVKK